MVEILKTCFKCHKDKKRSEFYVHKAMADGLLGKCKECTKKDVHEHRDLNIERVREYDRNRFKTNPDRRAMGLAKLRNFEERSPVARVAQYRVGAAIRDGRLIKKPCEYCGNKTVVAHHDDYLKPMEVRWLCYSHHSQWHVDNGPGKNRDIKIDEIEDPEIKMLLTTINNSDRVKTS